MIMDLQKGEKTVDTIKLMDYVISIQLSKITRYNGEHPKSNLNSATEDAMKNLIKLIELREEYSNKRSKKINRR